MRRTRGKVPFPVLRGCGKKDERDGVQCEVGLGFCSSDVSLAGWCVRRQRTSPSTEGWPSFRSVALGGSCMGAYTGPRHVPDHMPGRTAQKAPGWPRPVSCAHGVDPRCQEGGGSALDPRTVFSTSWGEDELFCACSLSRSTGPSEEGRARRSPGNCTADQLPDRSSPHAGLQLAPSAPGLEHVSRTLCPLQETHGWRGLTCRTEHFYPRD